MNVFTLAVVDTGSTVFVDDLSYCFCCCNVLDVVLLDTALDAWVRCAFDNVSATQVASGQVDPEVEMDKVQQHAYRWDSNYFMKTQPTTGRFGLQQQD